jgi:hypothetical protein
MNGPKPIHSSGIVGIEAWKRVARHPALNALTQDGNLSSNSQSEE